MTAAVYAVTVMIVAFVAAGAALVLGDEVVSGWILLGVALFGFLMLLSMVAADAAANRRE